MVMLGIAYSRLTYISPIFLDGNELKTMTYEVEPMAEGKITGDAYVIYGESKGSMEKVIDETFEIETVEVLDECEIKILQILYDKPRRMFYIEIENIADIKCYADVELNDIVLEGELASISSDIIEIESHKKAWAKIKARLEEEDLLDNEEVEGKAWYGERKNNLIKSKDFRFGLLLKEIDIWTFTLIPIIVILIILIIWLRKRRKKEGHRHRHK